MGSFMPDSMPGSFDPESGTFLPTGPASAPVAAPAPTGGSLASGVKGIFAKAAQESENKAQELAAETGMALNDARVVVGQERQRELAQQPAAQESIQRSVPTPRPVPMPPAAPIGSNFLPGVGMEGGIGGMLDPSVIANIREQIANSSEPVAATPMPPPPPPPPMPAPQLPSAEKLREMLQLGGLPPKPKTQTVTKPKKGRKKVVEPDQKSNKKRRRRRQRGPR